MEGGGSSTGRSCIIEGLERPNSSGSQATSTPKLSRILLCFSVVIPVIQNTRLLLWYHTLSLVHISLPWMSID